MLHANDASLLAHQRDFKPTTALGKMQGRTSSDTLTDKHAGTFSGHCRFCYRRRRRCSHFVYKMTAIPSAFTALR
jgi:hypothetical protein